MIPKRYTVVVENPSTGVVRRFTIRLRPVLGALLVLVAMPVLVGIGARWSARAELQLLRNTARTSEIENASYRAATAELAGQIAALQGTISELGKQASLEPATARALAKVAPAARDRAVGGAGDGGAIRSALSPVFVGPEDTFGILLDLLGRIENRLKFVRNDIEARSALVAATPTIWPALGWLSAGFGRRPDPFTGEEEFHSGIDISTDRGRPVVATAPGTVQSAAYNGAYGNLVVIDHGYGITTRYAHLSGYAVKAGDTVARNDVIGFVGATGRATGSHLHYEVLVNGRLIDPMQLIAGVPPRP